MGRWLEKIQKASDTNMPKPTKALLSPFVSTASGTFPKIQAQEIDRDRLRANVQHLAELLNMTPRQLIERGVIEELDYPQLAAMPPDVVRVLARFSSERLAK